MPLIPGTIIAAKITTGHTDATFPAVDQSEIKGGHHSVTTLTERDNIPAARREEGMTCWVGETSKEYRLVGGTANANWQEIIVAVSDGTLVYEAYQLGTLAYQLAQIGTNTGTAAYLLAQIGTTAFDLATAASSTANAAWTLAQIGTTAADSALTLATSGSNLAWEAWVLASSGTGGGGGGLPSTEFVLKAGDTMTGRLIVPSLQVVDENVVFGISYEANFDGAAFQTGTVTSDGTLSTTGRGSGKQVALRLFSDGTERYLTTAAGIRCLRNPPPFLLPADKIAVASFASFGTNESDTVLVFVEEA